MKKKKKSVCVLVVGGSLDKFQQDIWSKAHVSEIKFGS